MDSESGDTICTNVLRKPAFLSEKLNSSSIFSSSALDTSVLPISSNNDLNFSPVASLQPISSISPFQPLSSTETATNSVSIRTVFDAASPPLSSTATGEKSSSIPSLQSPPTPTPKPSAIEDELVRRIHRKVGVPAKLSTYDEPARVRRVVIEALATEQKSPVDASRVRRGQLSASERRVVRTVTNRGAAVRSRMRQRREMAALRMQVRARDGRVRQLEAVVRALCSAYAVPLPPSVGAKDSNNSSEDLYQGQCADDVHDLGGIGSGNMGTTHTTHIGGGSEDGTSVQQLGNGSTIASTIATTCTGTATAANGNGTGTTPSSFAGGMAQNLLAGFTPESTSVSPLSWS